MFAIVCEGKRSRVYLDPQSEHSKLAEAVEAKGYPVTSLPDKALGFRVQRYGMNEHWKLFTDRQLTALATFSDLAQQAREAIVQHSIDRNSTKDQAVNYANAVVIFLAFGGSKLSDRDSTLSSWDSGYTKIRSTFGRQALSMNWDFAEGNPFCESTGNWLDSLVWGAKVLDAWHSDVQGTVNQRSATSVESYSNQVISTDPPYYDNIGYADLSDYFYIWLRRTLHDFYPSLLGTMLTPKSDELIANPFIHKGGSQEAAEFFENGLRTAIERWATLGNNNYPATIFYAFKQSETSDLGTASTGWETFLSGVIENGFCITATWPMRTELGNRMRNTASNALASSIVLACVPRSQDASMVTRRDFANALRKELPEAIKHLQSGNVAPVDLAQASIGPGMAVFSRYSNVVNADGSPMSVREALQLINQVLDESLVEQESDFDSDTRFALRWYDQYGMDEGPFGDAEVLAKAMAVSVSGVVEAGIVKSGAGKVRLLKRDELNETWTPASAQRLTMWEATQYLIRRLESDGEQQTAELLVELVELKGSEYAESVRELSYRLYQTCERAKRAEEARSYNGLVVAWPEIFRLAMQHKSSGNAKVQGELL